ncbi:DMT family transporter [Carboxydochorda subterranea]|uniref:DMT family transporter n=1 Tax=Carboxydichorda subterranea TaxID=3109565 RepID=A0ABZ1C095_9FIRM|nr:DMT family transporter [Limnochorda sp. L945t]WRP18255.1 DMT family transporter [Limnochorda sp. L945t]
MQRAGAALMLAAAASIWGGMYAVSRVVMEQIPPWTLLGVRLAVGGAVLLAAALVLGERMPSRAAGLLGLAGLVGPGVSLGLQFEGTHWTGASVGALVTSASPAFMALFGWWLLQERPNGRQFLATAAAIAGAALMALGRPEGEGTASWAGAVEVAARPFLLGVAWLVGAALTWALYSVLVRLITTRYQVSALLTTAVASLTGLVVALPMALRETGPRGALAAPAATPAPAGHGLAAALAPLLQGDPGVVAGVAYLGLVSTALAFFLWSKGLESLEAATASLFFFLQPLVGTALGVGVLGEPASGMTWAGGALILLGVALASGGATGRGGRGLERVRVAGHRPYDRSARTPD